MGGPTDPPSPATRAPCRCRRPSPVRRRRHTDRWMLDRHPLDLTSSGRRGIAGRVTRISPGFIRPSVSRATASIARDPAVAPRRAYAGRRSRRAAPRPATRAPARPGAPAAWPGGHDRYRTSRTAGDTDRTRPPPSFARDSTKTRSKVQEVIRRAGLRPARRARRAARARGTRAPPRAGAASRSPPRPARPSSASRTAPPGAGRARVARRRVRHDPGGREAEPLRRHEPASAPGCAPSASRIASSRRRSLTTQASRP